MASGEGHGVVLAHPACGEGLDVDYAEEFGGTPNIGCLGFGGDLVHEGAGCVGGAVVDGEDFDGDGLGEEGAEGGFDGGCFVAGWDDDGELGSGWFGRRLVVAGVEEIGDAGKVASCGEGALGPSEGEEPGEEDGEDVENVHGVKG